MSLQVIVPGELEIERGKIPIDIATEVSAECQMLLDGTPDPLFYYVAVASTPESKGVIKQAFYRLKTLRESGFLALQNVLDLHPHPDSREANIFINTQEPGSDQNIHRDIVVGRQVIVHANDGGLFDYCPDSKDANYVETIEVNAGDILRLKCPSILHRGRNPSAAVRHTLVMSSNLPIE